jgi:uncharacterized paraquat-inducible protein A
MLDFAGWMLIPTFFIVLITYAIITAIRQQRRLKRMNFAWYAANHPAHIKNGKVSCMACNSKSIGTERLLERTYMRRHYCRQCGTTLYYSPEQL